MTTPELKPIAPIKLALVAETAHMPLDYQNATALTLLPIPALFWAIHTRLVDRAVCETDETTQQFLPYITLVNERQEVFVYGRGKGGGEARLVGNLSVGLGGHVDGGVPVGKSLEEWLREEGERELEEEAGFKPLLPMQFRVLIRDTTNPVGRVHMGLSSIVKVESTEIGTLEAGIIENGEWMTLAQLEEPTTYNRLENWSRGILALLQAMQTLNSQEVQVVIDTSDKPVAVAA